MLTRIAERRAALKRRLQEDAADASAGTIIPVKHKRVHRAGFAAELVKELPAVFTVFATAASALQGDHDATGRAIAAAELIAGACVLAAIVVEARHLFGRHTNHAHKASHEPSKVNATNLAAAALGFVESWHRTHVSGHFKLVSPQILGATVSLLTAFPRRRPASLRQQRFRPHVGITPKGINYRVSPRRRWRADWTDVAAIEHDHGEITVRLRDGRRHVLRADDHLDGDELVAEARAAISAHAPHVAGALSGATFAAQGS